MKIRWMITVLCVLVAGGGWAQSSAVQNFFEKYEDDPTFSVVEISPKMFELMSRLNIEDEDGIEELVQTVTGLKVLIKEGKGHALYEEAFAELSNVKFEELLKVRDKDENIRFMINESTDKVINELVLLVGGDSSFVMMDLTGNINLRSISKIGQALDVPGSEHLDKLEEKH